MPQELEGRVLAEAFEDTSPLARPGVRNQDSIYKDDDWPPMLSDEEMEEAQEKLRRRGYAG